MPIPFSTLKYKLITQLWKLARVERWLHQIPFLHHWLKSSLDTSPDDNDATLIPIRAVVEQGTNTVLPYPILQPLIELAQGHFLLDRCPCRSAEGCHAYPRDFGCLYLGPAVNDIPPAVGRKVSASEAMRHLTQGIQLGLVPMIVHARFDAEMLSIDYTQMLAVCFCCDCCCTVRHHLRMGPSSFDETIHRLPGLTVRVQENCIACSQCAEQCPVHAISIGESAMIDQETCIGCGLCQAVCPVDAIQLHIEDSDKAIEDIYRRIRARTRIGG